MEKITKFFPALGMSSCISLRNPNLLKSGVKGNSKGKIVSGLN
jgi:hypothetical protein